MGEVSGDIISVKHWLVDLKENIPYFVSHLKGSNGFYHYSLTGDVNQSNNWGLGNVVFIAKTLYMLGELTTELKAELSQFIKQYQTNKGYIYDPYVHRASRIRRLVQGLRTRDVNNLFGEQNKRAETRQSFAALRCLDAFPSQPFQGIPKTKEGVTKFIRDLNWNEPWGAASHVNHLLFFLYNNSLIFKEGKNRVDSLIDHVLGLLNSYQQDDGSWYNYSPAMATNKKVNAAMKVMLAYDSVQRSDFQKERELIDLCLSSINDEHACNNFNIICVLYFCQKKTDYRQTEIQQYAFDRLKLYRDFYWPEYGGFSFFRDRANSIYYGAKISQGKPEPDIHGTHLFLWGITLICEILGWNNEFGFRYPIT